MDGVRSTDSAHFNKLRRQIVPLRGIAWNSNEPKLKYSKRNVELILRGVPRNVKLDCHQMSSAACDVLIGQI